MVQKYFILLILLGLVAGSVVFAVETERNKQLIEAAREGQTKAVQALLEAGTDPNAKGINGITALMEAAFNGNTETAQVLLKAGADVNIKEESGWTALMFAAQEGQTEAMQALIKAGAGVNTKNEDGRTALMIATQEGHIEATEALLMDGAINYDGDGSLEFFYYTADFMATNANTNINIFYGLPINELKFERENIGVRVNYEVTFAIFDQKWNEVKRVYNRRSYQLSQEPDKSIKHLLMMDMQKINLPPGEYHYSVSVRDRGSNRQGVYDGEISVSHYKTYDFNMSQIVLASNITPFEGRRSVKFTRGEYNVMPLPSRTFRHDQGVFIYYEIYFPSTDEEGKKPYNVAVTIESKKLNRKTAPKGSISSGRLAGTKEEKGKITLFFENEGRQDLVTQSEYIILDIRKSPHGKYRINLVVTDAVSGETVNRSIDYYIVK
ncbi:MAG TPA: ankyrin repeat domain-containing protein [archaeon]|nr:ankyrin repeat domain-containing protein [archaeon]